MEDSFNKTLKMIAEKCDLMSFEAGMTAIASFIKGLNQKAIETLPKHLAKVETTLPPDRERLLKKLAGRAVKECLLNQEKEINKTVQMVTNKLQQYANGISDAHMESLASALRGNNDKQ